MLMCLLLVADLFFMPLASANAAEPEQPTDETILLTEETSTAPASDETMENTETEASLEPKEIIETAPEEQPAVGEQPVEDNGTELPETEAPPAEEAPLEEEAEEPVEEEQLEEEIVEEDIAEEEEPQAASVIAENILTAATITIENEAGDELEGADLNSIVNLHYTFNLPNGHGYADGSTFSFQLPKELNVYEKIEKLPLKKNNETVAYLDVSMDGTATLTFTKFIEENSNISGNFSIWSQLKRETIINEDRTIVITPIAGGASIVIPLNFNPGGPDISKKGTPNRAYNAETIDWTVDFNKSMQTLSNAVLEDILPSDQALQDGSIKMYHLITNMDGSTTLGALVNPNDYTISEPDFSIAFKNEIDSAYRVVFTVDITNDSAKNLINNATLKADGKKDATASATVTVGRGEPLQKTSINYDNRTQTIGWEIKYNYNQRTVSPSDAILTDLFDASQDVLLDTFVVKKISIDANGKEVGSGETVNDYSIVPITKDGKNGFTLQFNGTIDSAYKITYKTTANERVFEDGKITNVVTSESYKSTGTRNISQQILSKTNNSPNYKDKTVNWEINFNNDRQEMNNLVLKDVFTNGGLTFLPDSLKISGLTAGTDYVVEATGNNGFDIRFLKTITREHKITYKTAFNYEARDNRSLNYLQNDATLTWVNADGEQKEKKAVSNFTPDNYTQSNGFKNGSYNAVTKEITWKVGINYNLKTLEKAQVEDEIASNQKFLKDTLAVYEMSLTGGANGTEVKELTPGTDYSVSWVSDSKFIVEFKNTLTKPYMISYNTSLKDLPYVESTYKNTATLTSGGTAETALEASVDIPHGGGYATKTGAQNGKILNWAVNINFAQATIQNATLTDTPDANQEVLADTIRLYATTIGTGGQVTKGALLTEGTDYTLAVSEEAPSSFTIAFKETINKPYILEYQSFILKAPTSISNDVKLDGQNLREDKTETTKSVEVRRTQGMGEATGELGGLLITKTDKTTGNVLSGATFELKDPDSGITVKTGTTGADGTIQFERLLFGEYNLVETSAPSGYLNEGKTTAITIDNGYEKDNSEESGNAVTITNSKLIHAVQLEKVDGEESAKKLAGAQFSLYETTSGTPELRSLHKTDAQGQIYIEGLAPGDYQFVEITAPFGYALDNTPIPFTIGEKQLEMLKLDPVKNFRVKGGVELTKEDFDIPLLGLQGAVFDLQDASGKVILADLTTDENGKITISGLTPGDYRFVETAAPFGYHLDAAPIPFTIVDAQNEILKVLVKNRIIKGGVELTKTDADDSALLEGAVFELQTAEGTVIQSGLTTNEQGKLAINNLRPGAYQLVETKAPAFYQLAAEPFAFTIENGTTAQITKVNAPNALITGSVELTKAETNNAANVLAGAIFELQDAEGNALETNLVTDASGVLTVTDLKPGSYQLVETAAPTGYVLDATPYSFTIEPTRTVAEIKTVTINAWNEMKPGSVELTKVAAEDTALVLEGAVFELQDAEGNTLQEGLTTNAEGKFVVDGLAPGAYQFVETAAPFGYARSIEPIAFEIAFNQPEMLTIEVTNELANGFVELVKVDSRDSDITLAGAVFQLLDEQGNVLVERMETDAEGKIKAELKPGNYQFIEVEAPFGYELNSTPIPFTIEIAQETAVELTAQNVIIPGAVELLKVDSNRPERVLAGAVFKLLDAQGNVLQERLVTDSEGKIFVDELLPGKYQFIETKAPSRYRLDRTPVDFEIVLGQTETLEVTKTNRRFIPEFPDKPEIPVPPTDPEVPVDPEKPTDPEKPVDPEKPTDPEKPVDPEKPTDPEKPVDPEKPTDPETPVDPEKPTDPETPVDPEKPTDPVTPVDPEKPTDPETPVDPEKPTEPETPVDPEQPTEPETPVDPEQPTEPETPVDPEQPTEPVTPVTPETPKTPDVSGVTPDTGKDKADKPSAGKVENPKQPVKQQTDAEKLPQTGEEHVPFLMILGFVLLFAARRLLTADHTKN
ncbi:SpaA isopeptide-forming pilin-related protein [Planomicrobium sp. YIM 101495]|uniref:SpaA isopeptide-forming pilin-related protein n=1 Tax=Planomicrobium sp. YIM 101495 TaxID=2665160 RepID=UPI0018AA58E5|nr:SpaA isopeptide-forming pilin-related protein [Planomicrobium sp. YIM 101495]